MAANIGKNSRGAECRCKIVLIHDGKKTETCGRTTAYTNNSDDRAKYKKKGLLKVSLSTVSPKMANAPTLPAYGSPSLAALYLHTMHSLTCGLAASFKPPNLSACLRTSFSVLLPSMRRGNYLLVPYPVKYCMSYFPPDEVLG